MCGPLFKTKSTAGKLLWNLPAAAFGRLFSTRTLYIKNSRLDSHSELQTFFLHDPSSVPLFDFFKSRRDSFKMTKKRRVSVRLILIKVVEMRKW